MNLFKKFQVPFRSRGELGGSQAQFKCCAKDASGATGGRELQLRPHRSPESQAEEAHKGTLSFSALQ